MALSTVRAPELVGRGAEKQLQPIKQVAGPLLQAQQATLQESANHDGRDCSPVTRPVPRPSGTSSGADQVHSVAASALADGCQRQLPDAPQPVKRPAPTPPVQIDLDSIPSFAEQRPDVTKPLFLERHGTLKRIHLKLSTGVPASPTSPSAPAPTQPAQPDFDLRQILPGWEVARSKLWLLVETSLLQAQAAQAPSPGASPASPAFPSAASPASPASPAFPSPASPAFPSAASSSGTHARAHGRTYAAEPSFRPFDSWSPALATVPEASAPSCGSTYTSALSSAGPSSCATSFSTPSTSAPSAVSAPSASAPSASSASAPNPSPSPSLTPDNARQGPQPVGPDDREEKEEEGEEGGRPAALAPSAPRLTHATPFARRPTQLSVVEQTSAAFPSPPAATKTSLPSPSSSPSPPSPFGRCSGHPSRPCPPLPLGLGPLPLTLTPSLSMSARNHPPPRRRSHDGVVRHHGGASAPAPTPAGAASNGRSSSVDVGGLVGNQQDLQNSQQQQGGLCPRKKQHCLAYAAGVAAATSTATAVSHAMAAAAGGLTAAAGGLTAAAGGLTVALVDPHAAVVQVGADAVHAGTTFVMNRLQNQAINKSTLAAAEAVLGPAASASLRTNIRQRLRAALAGASVLWFCFNVHNMSDALGHLDFEHDFVTSAKVVMNLAVGGPSFMENCRELLRIGVAVSLGVAERNAAGDTNGGNNGGAGGGAGRQLGMGVAATEAVVVATGRY